MFRIYLKDATAPGNPAILAKTHTPDRDTALREFTALVNRTDLDGLRMAAVLSHNTHHLAYHRFDRAPDRTDYWRGRLDDIQWPT